MVMFEGFKPTKMVIRSMQVRDEPTKTCVWEPVPQVFGAQNRCLSNIHMILQGIGKNMAHWLTGSGNSLDVDYQWVLIMTHYSSLLTTINHY